VFLEKYIPRAKHIEVQILGDKHGNVIHCTSAIARCSAATRRSSRSRRRSACPNVIKELCDAAARIAREIRYDNAGTIEFLYDLDSHEWFFIEMNPRIQVEHTVTEVITGLDLVRAQILIAQGTAARPRESACPRKSGAAQRLRHPVPRHDRGSGEQVHAGLRQAPRLPLARRLRHPARRRAGLRRLGHYPFTIRCS
jgi:pyruvate carboxylase